MLFSDLLLGWRATGVRTCAALVCVYICCVYNNGSLISLFRFFVSSRRGRWLYRGWADYARPGILNHVNFCNGTTCETRLCSINYGPVLAQPIASDRWYNICVCACVCARTKIEYRRRNFTTRLVSLIFRLCSTRCLISPPAHLLLPFVRLLFAHYISTLCLFLPLSKFTLYL